MTEHHILYGWHLSYYAGKIRCYLRYKNIPFTDTPVDYWTLTHRIKRRTGAIVMPVVVTPEGEWLQDSSAIIDTFETRFPARPILPTAPIPRIAATLLETWADEWWMPVAMHTRWSYPENYPLFERDAGRALLPRFPAFLQRRAVAKVARLLRSYLPLVGVVPEQYAIIKDWTVRMLDHLDRHFATHRFLLGATPTIADFGLIGPMYGHLGRDPWPKRELIAPRPHLRAWIDRMADPKPEDGPRDEPIPKTLAPIFRAIADEFLPMTEAILAALPRTASTGQPLPRGLGFITHPMDGATFRRGASAFTLWKLQRLLDLHAAMTEADRNAVRTWLASFGAERLLALKIPRLRRVALQVALA